MRLKRFLLLLVTAGAAITAIPPADAEDEKKVLRMGWVDDPRTLNPFVGQDEQNLRIWAINWDLLVSFSPDDLSPAPGFARTWNVSKDKRTVTFKLIEGAKWSDGQPITSKDVKYSLDELGSDSLLFSGYTSNVTAVETPDDETVVIKTKQPDARIVGGLLVYMIPEHVYSKSSAKELTSSYEPPVPLVGSGPYVVTKYDRGQIVRMGRNRNFRGPKPVFDELQFIKYGNADAVERALRLGEIDMDADVEPASFEKVGATADVETVKAPSPAFTQLAFNSCSPRNCPNAKFNPAVQDRTVRQAIAYGIDRNRVNEISTGGTSFVGHGLLPQFYKTWYERPADDYPYDRDKANRMLDAAGYARDGDGTRQKGETKLAFDLFVRTESPQNVQAAKLVAEQAREIGVDFDVQPVSSDKLTEILTRQEQGKPAPEFDTFIWGWGGDPYDPSALLQLVTTDEIGASSDSFYSNPSYDRLFAKQSGEFDTARRKQMMRQMIAITQRDLPYLVLTQDPSLEAYRSDRLSHVQRACPRPDGDVLCAQVSYEPLLTLAPSSGDDDGGGASTGIIVAIVVVALGGLGFLVLRRRRGGGHEPLERP